MNKMETGRKTMLDNRYEVIIIGAGISGINTAYRLQSKLPDYTYTILEARNSLGGTWDLFNYPGIRSDSDLYTFGFKWQPWPNDNEIAEGPSIKKYINDAAVKHGIDRHIQYHKRVTAMDWSSEQQLWEFTVDADGKIETYRGRFVVLGTGYYDYNNPFPATIPGIDDFQGKVVHPQFWPEDLDYTDKKIAIIGSGATAVTLLPNLAEKASFVTMIQRSPSYVASRPMVDPMVKFARRCLPAGMGRGFGRWYNIFYGYFLLWYCRAFPKAAREMLRKLTIKELPENIPHDPHFQPSYNPFEQRLCVCPDGDFFAALRKGKGNVVTGVIKTMTDNKVILESGEHIDADIIVTATGLKVHLAGGIDISVDGELLHPSRKFIWLGSMIQDLPNAFVITGYTDFTWTPGADATAHLMCRLLKYLRKKGIVVATPKVEHPEKLNPEPLLNLSSTYLQAVADQLPMSSDKGPWKKKKNYFSDMYRASYGNIKRGLVFERATSKTFE